MNVIEMDVYIEKGLFVEKYCFEEKGHDEINIMECQWSEGLYKQGFLDYFKKADADIFCIQESKVQPGKLSLNLTGIINTGIMLRGKIFRYCGVYPYKASLCSEWYWN